MRKLLVIVGPTSTGKTALALQLAKKFSGELVACDSRQVYKGLDIGTGKDGAKAWMYDIVSLRKQYTVFDYVKEANKIIENISKRGKLPIVVGGTGLYLKALLEGMPNLGIPLDKKLRKQLNNLTIIQLQKILQKLNISRWQQMNNSDKQNPRRLTRAIEIARSKKRIMNYESRIMDFDILKIGLSAPRQILYQRINEKVLEWVKQGIINEVKHFLGKGISRKRIENLGLEYRVIIEYLDGKVSEVDIVKKMQDKVRAYARRQITWFKREKNISWFDIMSEDFPKKMEKEAAKWYYHPYAAKS